MIPQKKLNEVREYLEKSENPLFFFDDDPDGLCSFLLFRRYINRGKGFAIKSSPVLDLNYLRKINEYSPDFVFVLDKPIIGQEFVDNVNVPLIWLDHHPLIKLKGIHYYNPLIWTKKDNRPTTYWAYKIIKKDLWLATLGCVADWYIPTFIDEFKKKYKDLIGKAKEPQEILYETDLGRLIRIFSFLLKGRAGEVNKIISILSRVESPYEILNQETARGKFLFKRAEKISKSYYDLLEKALKEASKEKLFVFTYPTSKMSFTADLSNELLYKFPDKLILVAREKDGDMRLSFRSAKIKVRPILEKALVGVRGYGGGHIHACGGNIKKDDFNKFIDNIKKQIKEV